MATHTIVRHKTAPSPFACRWCGVEQRSHGDSYSRAVGAHLWARPTNSQIKARMKSRV